MLTKYFIESRRFKFYRRHSSLYKIDYFYIIKNLLKTSVFDHNIDDFNSNKFKWGFDFVVKIFKQYKLVDTVFLQSYFGFMNYYVIHMGMKRQLFLHSI